MYLSRDSLDVQVLVVHADGKDIIPYQLLGPFSARLCTFRGRQNSRGQEALGQGSSYQSATVFCPVIPATDGRRSHGQEPGGERTTENVGLVTKEERRTGKGKKGKGKKLQNAFSRNAGSQRTLWSRPSARATAGTATGRSPLQPQRR